MSETIEPATDTPTQLTAAHLRASFACFPSGVAAVCALIDGEPVGMAMSSFTSVSLDPPLVSVCVDLKSSTWPRLHSAPWLGVSILSEGQGSIGRSLASKQGDRFADVDYSTSANGALFVEGASLTLECQVYQEITAGDHEIILLRPATVSPRIDLPPLIFHGSTFRGLAS